jgi:hypothetical protein
MIVSRCRTGDESALCALFGFNVRAATTHLRTVRRAGGTISSRQATARHLACAICYMEKHTNFTQFPLKQNQTRSVAMPASRLPARRPHGRSGSPPSKSPLSPPEAAREEHEKSVKHTISGAPVGDYA